jgi:predicted nucleic acid-binding protein
MSNNKNNAPNILLDSDVIRHFISGGKILELQKIYPNQFVMLDKVKEELCRSKKIEIIVNNLISTTKLPIIPMPKDIQIIKEYANLKKRLGEGESACLAVAKFQKQFIASSNLKDIKTYCLNNEITYLTTMDILLEGYNKGIFDEADCDYFIYNVKSKGSKLPVDSINEYINRK